MGKRCRDISDNSLARVFVKEILGVSKKHEIENAVNQIVEAELGIDKVSSLPTVTHENYRNDPYVSSSDRRLLRDTVFEELITLKRLDDADEIELGKGGCLPVSTNAQQGKQLYLIIGLPASGKSSLADLICESTGSVLVDSDYAKRKLPEYHTKVNGASLVHKESQIIIMGDPSNEEALSVYQWGLSHKMNMVYPCIGNKYKEIIALTQNVIDVFGYDVHLILVNLDRIKATKRAYTRYMETKRYIPLSKIYDEYANDPALTYYIAKEQYCDLFKSFTHFDTDVPRKERYRIICQTDFSPIAL